MTTPPCDIRAVLLALFCPWLLHRAAAGASVLFSLVAGIAGAIGVIVSLLVIRGITTGLGPPLPSVLTFLFVAIGAGLLLFALVPGTLWIRLGQRARAKLSASLLLPVTLILPIAAWLAIAEYSRDASIRSMLLAFPSGWPTSSPTLAASLRWLIPIFLAAAANLWLALARLSHMTFPDDGNICPSCHYPLRGLPPNSPCPECGTTPHRS